MKKMAVLFCFILILMNENNVDAQVRKKVKMLPWKEADVLLPKYEKFVVMDFETRKSFRVQRRAGSHHADVQPLTPEDTKIMKNIYNGQWSWKRRAVIIIHKNQWIAASMHGMPHGAGALKNNFPGHFCIHFYGSTTHSTKSMDLAHMLMIYKAAGKLESYMGSANPYEVINACITGLQQKDAGIAAASSLQKLNLKPILAQIAAVRIVRIALLPPEDLTQEISLDIPIEIDWFLQNKGKQTFKGEVHLIRFSQYDPWKIDMVHFLNENNFIFTKTAPISIIK